jgi:hypothetical protein
MKKLLVPLVLLFLTSGCAVSSLSVIEKKETLKPFSNILVVYVDNDIDFSVFDSLTYNICLKPSFSDTASLNTRGNTEKLLSDGLSAPRSNIIRSSDVFGPDFDSYYEFMAQMDSLGVDAILLVHLHGYTYSNHELPVYERPVGSNPRTYVRVGGSFNTPNGAFACYLIKTHDYLPLWKAEVDVKGKGYYNGKRALKSDMVGKIENSLVTCGYISPHR